MAPSGRFCQFGMKNDKGRALSSEELMQRVAILLDPRDCWMAALYSKRAERNNLALGGGVMSTR